MRTTIDLPEDLLRRAKAQAALDGTTLKDLVTRFVDEGLQRLRDLKPRSRTPVSDLPILRLEPGTVLPFSTQRELLDLLDREDYGEYLED